MKQTFYSKYIKRLLDIVCSLLALIVLSPLFLVLMLIGAIKMKGNPFFTQERPGYKEKIFKLIKFRTMTNETDGTGKLLPDEERLNKYGKFIRSTSLDELPELINILVGDMSVVGPRPLMARYLSFYNENERKRHNVRPGLTGYAQIHGRNIVDWSDRLAFDIEYIQNISFALDIKIVFKTVLLVLKREGTDNEDMINFDDFRRKQWETGEEEHENTVLHN